LNLAELYFESLEGAANPARFTPMNSDVREQFHSTPGGFDPIELWTTRKDPASLGKFLDFRAGLARKMQEEWLKEGEKWTREALSIWERIAGPDDPSVAVGLTNLAVLLQARKQYEEAALLLSRARNINEKKYPANHPRIGMDLNAAGVLATARKNYREAEDLLVRSAVIVEKALSPQDPARGQVLLNLGEVYRLEKKMGQAGEALKRGLTTVMAAWDPNDARLPAWMDKLVLVLRSQEEFAAAEELEIRATRIRTKQALH